MQVPTIDCAKRTTPEEKRRKGTLQYTAAGLGMLFFYLLWGDFVMQMMDTVVPAVMPLQLKAMGASNKTIGLLIKSMPFFFNMTINPFVSYHSDNIRTAWGRRRPYLILLTPFVTLSVVLLGYGPEIGAWAYPRFFSLLDPKTALICTFGFLLALYQVFHYLMSPMYYYLFVDVVPDAYMGRFMALFRVVFGIKGYLFNYFIFGHALTHTRWIYVGCALLYGVGFMWMALMVKEGEYPPPTQKRKATPWGLISIYCRECYSNRHYLYFNLRNATWSLAAATDIYGIFLATKDLELSTEYVGKVKAWTIAIGLLLVYPFGMICDRFRPIRVLLFAATLHLPMALIAFYFMTGRTSYVVITLIMLPISALMGAADMPFYAMIPPRERYGQFGAANQVIIGLMQIFGGFVAGWYMDFWTKSGETEIVTNYRYLFLWSFAWQMVSLLFMFLLYRSWLRHGGPDAYVPPQVGQASPAPQTVN